MADGAITYQGLCWVLTASGSVICLLASAVGALFWRMFSRVEKKLDVISDNYATKDDVEKLADSFLLHSHSDGKICLS